MYKYPVLAMLNSFTTSSLYSRLGWIIVNSIYGVVYSILYKYIYSES